MHQRCDEERYDRDFLSSHVDFVFSPRISADRDDTARVLTYEHEEKYTQNTARVPCAKLQLNIFLFRIKIGLHRVSKSVVSNFLTDFANSIDFQNSFTAVKRMKFKIKHDAP